MVIIPPDVIGTVPIVGVVPNDGTPSTDLKKQISAKHVNPISGQLTIVNYGSQQELWIYSDISTNWTKLADLE